MSLLTNLAPVNFADKDPQKIQDEMVAIFSELDGRTLAQADPVYLFLKGMTAEIVNLRATVDFTGKQNLLAYAIGEYLEQKVADFKLSRIPAVSANVMTTFTLVQPLSTALIIPKGTLVTPDGKIFFMVPEDAVVPIGDKDITLKCICTTAGIAGNNIAAGLINQITSKIAYVQSAVSITVSSGGADAESDDDLRNRRLLAPDKLSTAGPEKSYEYYARATLTNIIDVDTYSPTAGVVRVAILMKDGALPTPSELDAVYNGLTPSSVRPLTDKVEVVAPVQVDYTIDLTYWLSNKPNSDIKQLQKNITDAVDQFIFYEKTKLGRSINPSILIKMVMSAGARRVEVKTPKQLEIGRQEVANVTNVNIVFGGLEADV